MARFNYNKIAQTGQKLIQKFGYNAVIRRTVDSVDTDFSVTIVMLEYHPQARDGALILQNDRKALLSAIGLTFTPDPETDKLIEGSHGLQIVTVTPTSPAGVPLLYELQVRR